MPRDATAASQTALRNTASVIKLGLNVVQIASAKIARTKDATTRTKKTEIAA